MFDGREIHKGGSLNSGRQFRPTLDRVGDAAQSLSVFSIPDFTGRSDHVRGPSAMHFPSVASVLTQGGVIVLVIALITRANLHVTWAGTRCISGVPHNEVIVDVILRSRIRRAMQGPSIHANVLSRVELPGPAVPIKKGLSAVQCGKRWVDS